jgi:hypothetical protein
MAGDEAKVKVFVIAVPPIPEKSAISPELVARYRPVALTHSGAASGIQALPNGRAVFSHSSFTSPNDVFLISGLERTSAFRGTVSPCFGGAGHNFHQK